VPERLAVEIDDLARLARPKVAARGIEERGVDRSQQRGGYRQKKQDQEGGAADPDRPVVEDFFQ
jgi:hypothetical protein